MNPADIALVLIFLNIILVLYALVVSGQRPLLVFTIIPVFVFTVFYTWNIINYYRGLPLQQIPTTEVQLIASKIDKPHIYVLLGEKGYPYPRYYRLPYTKSNEEKTQRLQQTADAGVVIKGRFRFAAGENENFEFELLVPFIPEKEPASTKLPTAE